MPTHQLFEGSVQGCAKEKGELRVPDPHAPEAVHHPQPGEAAQPPQVVFLEQGSTLVSLCPQVGALPSGQTEDEECTTQCDTASHQQQSSPSLLFSSEQAHALDASRQDKSCAVAESNHIEAHTIHNRAILAWHCQPRHCDVLTTDTTTDSDDSRGDNVKEFDFFQVCAPTESFLVGQVAASGETHPAPFAGPASEALSGGPGQRPRPRSSRLQFYLAPSRRLKEVPQHGYIPALCVREDGELWLPEGQRDL